MIGNAAREEMQAFAARGRLGDRILRPQARLEVPRRGERGGHVNVQWNVSFAEQARLRITRPGQAIVDEVVQLAGRRQLHLDAVGQYQIAIVATASTPRAGRRRRVATEALAQLDVVAPRPVVRLIVPARVTFGQRVRVSWTVAEADQAELIIDGVPQRIDLLGETEVELDECRQCSIALVAHGEGGRTERRQLIHVAAPRINIRVDAAATAQLGQEAVVNYAITGARSATAYSMDCLVAPREIPLRGRIELRTAIEPERVRIIAEGHDGRRAARTVIVRAAPSTFLSIEEELALLHEGHC